MKYLIGIVLYNPEIKNLYFNLQNWENNKIVLIDNSSKNIQEIEEAITKKDNVILIRNSINMGIAQALNQIMEYAVENSFQWVLTLDQDSKFHKEGIQIYLKNISKEIAIITCRVQNINTTISEEYIVEKEYVDDCITSGSFHNVEIWQKLKGFDEWLFIDYVDFEYCIRVKKQNYKILKCNSVLMQHSLGKLEIKSILGKKIYITNHSPLRCYYLLRNLIYTYRKHKEISNHQNIYIRIIKQYIKILVFEKDKMKKCKAMNKGIFDGMRKEIY